MENFLNSALKTKSKSKRSLYISGAPGTGKTVCLKFLLQKKQDKIKQIFVNCMGLKNPKDIYSAVANAFDPDTDIGYDQAQRFVVEQIKCSKEPVLLVLDEVDQLASKDQAVLYSIFEWPYLPKSKLILVGIANTLDFTDRVLPRLQLAHEIAPTKLSFPAYSDREIEKIITSRLDCINNRKDVENVGEPLIKPIAIKFLSKKISTMSGDIRKALDVCRRAIELAEIEYKKQTILSPGVSPSRDGIKQIDLPQIQKIFGEIYSSKVISSMSEANSDLPLQQKMLMATLLLISKNGPTKVKEVRLGKLHETYSRICKKRNMCGMDLSEATLLCGLLESRGFFGVKKAKDVRDSRITLRIDEREVEVALKDKTLLTSITEDVACISK